MTIEKRKSDGAIIISETYLGFTEKESKSLFKRDKKKGWL